MLKLGYKASAEQFGPTELLKFSRLAEQSGFDSVFISDHFQPWKHHGGHAPFSLAWLGALGAVTSRITIGTSVLTPTFRYHPAVVAQAFATLGVMFPNRIVLGVGTGGKGTFGPVTDNKNGTYTATFTGTLAGKNSITATIGGVKLTSTAAAAIPVQAPLQARCATGIMVRA